MENRRKRSYRRRGKEFPEGTSRKKPYKNYTDKNGNPTMANFRKDFSVAVLQRKFLALVVNFDKTISMQAFVKVDEKWIGAEELKNHLIFDPDGIHGTPFIPYEAFVLLVKS